MSSVNGIEIGKIPTGNFELVQYRPGWENTAGIILVVIGTVALLLWVVSILSPREKRILNPVPPEGGPPNVP